MTWNIAIFAEGTGDCLACGEIIWVCSKVGEHKSHPLPASFRQRAAKFRHGPGVFKVDWALNGPIPWKAPGCAEALAGALQQLVGVLEGDAMSAHLAHDLVEHKYWGVNGARVEYADVNNTADRGCLNYAANLPAGTHTVLIESLDASAAPGIPRRPREAAWNPSCATPCPTCTN